MNNEQIDRVGMEVDSRWKKITLGDVIDVKHGYAFNGKPYCRNPNK